MHHGIATLLHYCAKGMINEISSNLQDGCNEGKAKQLCFIDPDAYLLTEPSRGCHFKRKMSPLLLCLFSKTGIPGEIIKSQDNGSDGGNPAPYLVAAVPLLLG